MGHFPAERLHIWKRGDTLTAEGLNDNFAELQGMAATIMAVALSPDPAAVELEKQQAALARRVEVLERLSLMHERQRNEKEWAPLSHVGALIELINQAQTRFVEVADRLAADQARIGAMQDEADRRLARLEQQPGFATQQEFAVLARDHDRLALKEHMLLAQIVALRHEVGLLRELALGHDRLANRLEYAPLSYVGNLLQRVQALEEQQQ